MKKLVLLLMILSLLVTTACWDMIDIEKRAYVLGVAIDQILAAWPYNWAC